MLLCFWHQASSCLVLSMHVGSCWFHVFSVSREDMNPGLESSKVSMWFPPPLILLSEQWRLSPVFSTYERDVQVSWAYLDKNAKDDISDHLACLFIRQQKWAASAEASQPNCLCSRFCKQKDFCHTKQRIGVFPLLPTGGHWNIVFHRTLEQRNCKTDVSLK